MSFMRRNTRKGAASDARPGSSAPADGGPEAAVTKAKIYVKNRRDHTLVLGWELPEEFVGERYVVCVGLTKQRKQLAALEQDYRALLQGGFRAQTSSKDALEHSRSLMKAQMKRENGTREIVEIYREKFGLYDQNVQMTSGLLAYEGYDNDKDCAIFRPAYSSDEPSHVAESQYGTVTLQQIPQDAEIDIVFWFNVKLVDGRWNLAPLYELRLQTRLNKATWAIALEQAGLSSLVGRFQARRLTTYERWAAVIDDATEREDLQIDERAADIISEIIAREGFITAAERERLDEERQEMAVAVKKLSAQAKDDTARFYLGQLVNTGSKKSPVLGVVVHVGEDAVGVRPFGKDGDEARALRRAELQPHAWKLFLSHSQRDAQNQVQNLHILLRAAGVAAWYDMDAEKLEAIDMIRGVRDAEFFCIFLTAGYFERWFCRLEASYAQAQGKSLLIVYEPDFRHGGSGEYVELVERATHKFPEFKEWLLGSEAIPMARRAFQRQAMVSEIVKRVGGALPALAAAAGPQGGAKKGGGVASGETVEDLKEEVLKLWDVVEGLQDEIARLKLETQQK